MAGRRLQTLGYINKQYDVSNDNSSHLLLTQIIITDTLSINITNVFNASDLIMYVCVCKGITDRQIKAAIDQGANTLGQIRKALGVATQCGKCAVTTREILDEALSVAPMVNGIPQYYAVA